MWLIIILCLIVVAYLVLRKGNRHDVNTASSNIYPVSEMYESLSREERMALLDLASMFASHIGVTSGNMLAVNSIFVPYTHMLGFNKSETMNRWGNLSNFNPKDMVEKLKNITDKGVLDTALYTCFCMVGINKDETMIQLLSNVFNELGYSDDDIINTVQKIEALGNYFNNVR